MDLDTIQATTAIFDRTLSAVAIRPKQLQVCALTALFFTVKVLESHPFRAKELEKYFSAVATPLDVTRAERNMLRILDWDVNVFTPVAYVRWLLALVPDERLARDLGVSAEILSAWAMLGACVRRPPRLLSPRPLRHLLPFPPPLLQSTTCFATPQARSGSRALSLPALCVALMPRPSRSCCGQAASLPRWEWVALLRRVG
jgi:hypothetical protein